MIKAEMSLDKTVKGVITKSWEKLRLYLSYQVTNFSYICYYLNISYMNCFVYFIKYFSNIYSTKMTAITWPLN